MEECFLTETDPQPTPQNSKRFYHEIQNFYEACSEPRNIVLIPDRSLSPTGSRKLKSLRCKNMKRSQSRAFHIPELAERIYTDHQQKRPQFLAPLERYLTLKRIFPQKQALREFHQLLNTTQQILKNTTKAATLHTLIQEIEEKNPHDQNLKKSSESLLGALAFLGQAESENRYLNNWLLIERVLEKVPAQSLLEKPALFEFLEPALNTNEIQIIIPLSSELYPEESRFLNYLGSQFPLHFYTSSKTENNLGSEEVLKSIPFINTSSKEYEEIIWCSDQALPSASALKALIPHHELHFMGSRFRGDNFEKQRCTLKILESLEEKKELNKIFEKSVDLKKICNEWNLSNTFETYKSFLNSFEALDEKQLFLDHCEELKLDQSDNFSFLCENGFFEKFNNRETKKPSLDKNFSFHGKSLLHWKDLLLLAPQSKALLLTDQESWQQISDPNLGEKTNSLKEMLSFLEAQGLAVPREDQERSIAKNLLHTYSKNLLRLNTALKEENFSEKEISINPAKERPSKKTLSPSRIESYMRCPRQYYFQKEAAWNAEEEWDPLELNALKKGNWIHSVLEHFFKAPVWTDFQKIEKKIQKLLNHKIEESFSDHSTTDYRELISKNIEYFSQRLTYYLYSFEAKIQEQIPLRTFKNEYRIQGSLEKQDFYGFIDRVDFIDSKKCFLWDYKTGNFANKFPTLLKNGKIQWLLYAQLLEDQGIQVMGGGYLNPLDSKKSKVILFDDAWNAPQSLRKQYNIDLLPSLDKEKLFDSLNKILKEKIPQLQTGHFPPIPLKEEHCTHCDFRSVCGRPFYRKEQKFL